MDLLSSSKQTLYERSSLLSGFSSAAAIASVKRRTKKQTTLAKILMTVRPKELRSFT
jgi:hypothetical protein